MMMASSPPDISSLSIEEIVQALVRLEVTLKSLNDKQSAPTLSHYRIVPSALQNAWNLLHQGASLVYATSTKFTLMGKIDINQATGMGQDLLKGCQCVGTATLVIHQDSTGCSRSLKHVVKQAARAVVHATMQLVQSFVDQTALITDTVGAQKTGAVWEACQAIIEHKVPNCNRDAIRRDALTYVKECNETMEEFQDMIDAGPSLREGDEESDKECGVKSADDNGNEDEQEPSWDDFLQGNTDHFTCDEMPVATATLALVKCSRGCINVAIQACDGLGVRGQQSELEDDGARLQWIGHVYDLVHAVGEGMTDLGAVMYPPIQVSELSSQVERQTRSMTELLAIVLDPTTGGETISFGREVANLATKLQVAVVKRKQEFADAMDRVENDRR